MGTVNVSGTETITVTDAVSGPTRYKASYEDIAVTTEAEMFASSNVANDFEPPFTVIVENPYNIVHIIQDDEG